MKSTWRLSSNLWRLCKCFEPKGKDVEVVEKKKKPLKSFSKSKHDLLTSDERVYILYLRVSISRLLPFPFVLPYSIEWPRGKARNHEKQESFYELLKAHHLFLRISLTDNCSLSRSHDRTKRRRSRKGFPFLGLISFCFKLFLRYHGSRSISRWTIEITLPWFTSMLSSAKYEKDKRNDRWK